MSLRRRDQAMTSKYAAPTVAVFVAACIVMNGLIFAMGWQDQSASGRGLLPPGWVIGLVWIGLFAGLGFAYWRLGRHGLHDGHGRQWILWLAAWCLAYPLYTAGLSSRSLSLAGNVATIALALVLAVWLWPHERTSAALVASIAVWVAYATVGLALAP